MSLRNPTHYSPQELKALQEKVNYQNFQHDRAAAKRAGTGMLSGKQYEKKTTVHKVGDQVMMKASYPNRNVVGTVTKVRNANGKSYNTVALRGGTVTKLDNEVKHSTLKVDKVISRPANALGRSAIGAKTGSINSDVVKSLSPLNALRAKVKGQPGAAQGASGKHGGNPCHDDEGKFC